MEFAKLSKHGYSQEVRLPKKYRMSGTKVKISKYGQGVLLEPIPQGFDTLLESLDDFSDDFMKEGRESLPNQEREELL